MRPWIVLLSDGDEATAMARQRSFESEGRMLLFIPESCRRSDEIGVALADQDVYVDVSFEL